MRRAFDYPFDPQDDIDLIQASGTKKFAKDKHKSREI